MTNTTILIIVLAVLVYICRLSGFLITFKQAPAWLQHYLEFVPLAVFAAFIIPSMMREIDLLGIKIVALIIAGLIIRKTSNLGLSILVGLGTLWILLLI